MALILKEEKYNSVKKALEKKPKVSQQKIAEIFDVSRVTVSRIQNSKDYREYLKKYTTNRPTQKEQPLKIGAPKAGFFRRLFGRN